MALTAKNKTWASFLCQEHTPVFGHWTSMCWRKSCTLLAISELRELLCVQRLVPNLNASKFTSPKTSFLNHWLAVSGQCSWLAERVQHDEGDLRIAILWYWEWKTTQNLFCFKSAHYIAFLFLPCVDRIVRLLDTVIYTDPIKKNQAKFFLCASWHRSPRHQNWHRC